MLENITKIIARFFGIIAGSLSGISAILIAIGYLAERSHLKMLGFTTIPVDLNQYLYTGANLVGFLPGIIILQSISLLLEPLSLFLIVVVLAIRFSLRYPAMNVFWQKSVSRIQRTVVRFKITFLIVFVFIQILSLNWMVKPILVENLLFTETSATATQQEFTFLAANISTIKEFLIAGDKTGRDELSRYFTQLFLITILIGLAIRYLAFSGRENKNEFSFHMKFWLGINFLLFATQIFLLPCNYGVLLLNNKYQEVKVQFIAGEPTISQNNEKMLQKNDNHAPVLENKIRDQQLELNGALFRYDLEASPEIFTDPDGDKLSYVATSDNPEVARSEMDKNILIVRPLRQGKALISVEAADDKGLTKTTNLEIGVEDEISKWGAKATNTISPVTLTAGENPFARDLMAEPSLFEFLDIEPVHLTFQAVSSTAKVAEVNISGNELIVQPVSKGTAVVKLAANDGFGRFITSEFNVNVLGQNLEWPLDDRLLLLYQSDDVFYLYSKLERRIWYVRSGDIESMVYYGLDEVF